VVFPCGHVLQPDGDEIHLYYGAADSCIALATGSLQGMLDWLDAFGKPFPPRGQEHPLNVE
jgi:predicted GH43/DUF377 family glycosyl hydrolase